MKAKPELQTLAREQRQSGMSLLQISKELQVAKSSVSVWCRDIIVFQIKTVKEKPVRKDRPSSHNTCESCGEKFLRRQPVNGKIRRLDKRRNCLDCQPFHVKKATMRNGDYLLMDAPPDFPGLHYRDKYCYEHTYVYWQNTGVIPGPNECVHHKNENRHDNRFSNLEIKTKVDHSRDHSFSQIKNWALVKCPTCGNLFVKAQNTISSKASYIHCSCRCSSTKIKPYQAESIVRKFRHAGPPPTVSEAEAILAVSGEGFLCSAS